MRTLFSVASKLLGVYFAYLGLIYLLSAIVFLESLGAPVQVQFLSAALAFGFAFVLMFRSEGLGRRLGVDTEESSPIGRLEPGAALHTGIVLIGLYVFISRLALALSTASAYLGGADFGGVGGAPVRIMIEAIPLALAVFFILGADRIVELVERTPATVA